MARTCLRLSLHIIDHLAPGLSAHRNDHGSHDAYLGQGRLNLLVALGGGFSRSPLDYVIHHEQHLTETLWVRPQEEVLTLINVIPKA